MRHQVSNQNDYGNDAVGDRTSIDLIAPGENILTADIDNVQSVANGTSLSAPHASGSAALLQEYANNQIRDSVPGWDADATRHEVMKAVLMNSADKLEDSGDGMRLGMSRTVYKQDGTSTWLDSDAYNPTSDFAAADTLPLDLEMGAGHLNARRAVKQLAAGEHDAVTPSGTTVPQIGWDYANTNDTGGFRNEYVFTDPLPQGSFVSITLAWDRIISLDMDGGVQTAYDTGDTFDVAGASDEGFNDLDIYLLPVGSTSPDDAVAQSISSNNLEHLFWQVPTTGMYEFWVYEFDSPISLNNTDYAVAWWAYTDPAATAVLGDANGDGVVNTLDTDPFVLAVTDPVNYATAYPSIDFLATNDINMDGFVNTLDIDPFVALLTGGSSLIAVPEPMSLALIGLFATGLAGAGRSRQ